jgi:three-Cys-motif partner protein
MTTAKYDWRIGDAAPVLETHSRTKHAVFRSYVRRYVEILTSNPRREALDLTLIDGFAGGGEYVYQGEASPGSPMILLQEVACAQARFDAERTKRFRLNVEYIFVERSKPNWDYLEYTIRASEYAGLLGESVHLLNSRFDEVLP